MYEFFPCDSIAMSFRIIHGDCGKLLEADKLGEIDLSFLDPPFNQAKHYASHNDAMPEEKYWECRAGSHKQRGIS